jgi:hypothetical protein
MSAFVPVVAASQAPPSEVQGPPSVAAPAAGFHQMVQLNQTSPGRRDNSMPGIEDEDAYRTRITNLLYQRNFEQLDAEAYDARVSKTRFPGGIWKLYVFYEGVDTASRNRLPEHGWGDYMSLTKMWVERRPKSVTARIALAEAYLHFGWHARGHGYADEVTEIGAQLFAERANQAKAVLEEAAQLDEKCPFWYESMQHVALALGWNKQEARKLFEQAVAFAPGFYHYYREYAIYLLPKWYGEDGDAELFAEEVSEKFRGKGGLFLYFEIATVINCPCTGDGDPRHLQKMSWPKIKQGYAVVKQMYGTSRMKTNRFA